jgi:vacuolar-type H+-ATPase subunit E/Vma4
VDPRDEALVCHLLHELGLQLPVVACLRGWGGLVARSADGRVLAINTLAARLERAMPFLQQELATFFEHD